MPRPYFILITVIVLVREWTAQCTLLSPTNETLCMNVTVDPDLICGENEVNKSSVHTMCHTFHSPEAHFFPVMMFKSAVKLGQMHLPRNMSETENISNMPCSLFKHNNNRIGTERSHNPRGMGAFNECYHLIAKAKKKTKETPECRIKLVLREPIAQNVIWKKCHFLSVTNITLSIHLEKKESGDEKKHFPLKIIMVVVALLSVVLIVSVLALKSKATPLHIHIEPVPPVANYNPTVGEMVRSNSLEDHIYEEISLNGSGVCCNAKNDPSPPNLEIGGAAMIDSTTME